MLEIIKKCSCYQLVGIVKSKTEDICELELIDTYGQQDGTGIIKRELITQISMNSAEENNIKTLYVDKIDNMPRSTKKTLLNTR